VRRWRNAPYRVADIVGDQQCTILVQCQAGRTAMGMARIVEKARHNILSRDIRIAVAEENANDIVTVEHLRVPTAMFTNEGTAAVASRH
jgi:hypothetical protein